MNNTTPQKALWGFLTKHLISLMDMIDDLDKGQHHPRDTWDEKLGDAINYLVLLDALQADSINF